MSLPHRRTSVRWNSSIVSLNAISSPSSSSRAAALSLRSSRTTLVFRSDRRAHKLAHIGSSTAIASATSPLLVPWLRKTRASVYAAAFAVGRRTTAPPMLPRCTDDQSLRLEDPERLAHRRRADAEPLEQRVERRQPLTVLQLTEQDELPDPVGHDVAHPGEVDAVVSGAARRGLMRGRLQASRSGHRRDPPSVVAIRPMRAPTGYTSLSSTSQWTIASRRRGDLGLDLLGLDQEQRRRLR